MKHKLKIISYHDAQADCEGCNWHYKGTGERTLDEIETLYSLQSQHINERRHKKWHMIT
jgi:hypothetical protein